MKTLPNNVAVYGSLRYGALANYKLRGCTRIGIDKICGVLYTLGAFPALKITDDQHKVVVDVYSVPMDILQELDYYEGYKVGKPQESLYNRVRVTTEKGLSAFTYVYNWNVHSDNRIMSGDWLNQDESIRD